jgi:hypothetical protein
MIRAALKRFTPQGRSAKLYLSKKRLPFLWGNIISPAIDVALDRRAAEQVFIVA